MQNQSYYDSPIYAKKDSRPLKELYKVSLNEIPYFTIDEIETILEAKPNYTEGLTNMISAIMSNELRKIFR
ncbi:hypothetical protein KCQ_05571 [Pectobacterium atrosepticum ICMP 1526]|uniref:hypothetical protein n=1 Tax=Pectobacterium atrosepticum TaxID=29471 RepID=UPI0005052C05|nr:hypothetical protein [Pectobacterium atrosepticum]KFX10715.1 hypothetical protein JV34_22590 [Pectobacterium atrosepticum]KMK87253.1 hypothetical protein KCQ_05571 [Pectobacterium atrosepticum ICMP 1526]